MMMMKPSIESWYLAIFVLIILIALHDGRLRHDRHPDPRLLPDKLPSRYS